VKRGVGCRRAAHKHTSTHTHGQESRVGFIHCVNKKKGEGGKGDYNKRQEFN